MFRCVSVFVVLATTARSAMAFDQYVLTDIGMLDGGSYSFAFGLSESGNVVGEWFHSPTGYTRSYIWTAERGMRDLNVPAYESAAYGVNDAGVVVGNVTSPQPEIGGYLWTEGTGVVRFERPIGGVTAINQTGQVAGGTMINNENASSLWTPSTPNGTTGTTQYNAVPGQSNLAFALNNHGILGGIVHRHVGPNQVNRGMIWRPGVNHTVLPALREEDHSSALGLNDGGTAVGYSGIDSSGFRSRAVIWSPEGTIQDLGTPSDFVYGKANDINNAGTVVGRIDNGISSSYRAALWTGMGDALDLNTVVINGDGWLLRQANAINDRGQIVGYAGYNGQTRAFLLTPVPEPSGLAAVACAIATIVTLRVRGGGCRRC